MQRLTSAILILFFFHRRAIGASIADAAAIEAAQYVLHSLQNINDSGIYAESLHLHSVPSASIVKGRFHTNKLLTIHFSSPHFASGKETESFEVIVMESEIVEGEEGENFGDNVRCRRRGYAIDRFPEMNEEEIKKARQRKVARIVEENKRIREDILSWERVEIS